MLKIALLLTLDYEIQGWGEGSFYDLVYEPTKRMLNLCDEFQAKITIMAEVGHYWAMQRYPEVFSEDINLFESQLKNAVLRGHDIQLHIHPQWFDSQYSKENNKWDLKFEKDSISRLCHNRKEALHYIKLGKRTIEEIIKPVKSSYQCRLFRAGFFQAEPSRYIIEALEENDFIADSSVAKEIKVDDDYCKIDYSDAYSNHKPWYVNKDYLKYSGNSKIIELPIFTIINRFGRGFNRKLSRVIAKLPYAKYIGTYLYSLDADVKFWASTSFKPFTIKSLINQFRKRYQYLDFVCDNHERISISLTLISMDNDVKDSHKPILPIVLISHSKHFTLDKQQNLYSFLIACKKNSNINIMSFSDYVLNYLSC